LARGSILKTWGWFLLWCGGGGGGGGGSQLSFGQSSAPLLCRRHRRHCRRKRWRYIVPETPSSQGALRTPAKRETTAISSRGQQPPGDLKSIPRRPSKTRAVVTVFKIGNRKCHGRKKKQHRTHRYCSFNLLFSFTRATLLERTSLLSKGCAAPTVPAIPVCRHHEKS
jgi:hypothetical protein